MKGVIIMIIWRRLFKILKRTGMMQVFVSFCVFLSVCAIALYFWDPGVKSVGDGFWYCFVASTTIGFGDVCVSTVFGRIVTVILSLYGILTAAMIPGVVVTYYTEFIRIREQDTVSVFLEKLEHLPDLSKEDLEKLSEKVKAFNKSKRKH